MNLKQLLSDFFKFLSPRDEDYSWKEIIIGLLILMFIGLIGWVYSMSL